MKVHLHQTHHSIGDFDSIFQELTTNSKEVGLHLYPELFLTGYPLQDLCLQANFRQNYHQFLEKIKLWCQSVDWSKEKKSLLLGGLDYINAADGSPLRIENVIFSIDQNGLTKIYTKRLLPNYDIFDEQKYFKPGKKPAIYEFYEKKIGLLVCEDMWPSTFHDLDPCQELYQWTRDQGMTLDLVVNLSASPFDWSKQKKRNQRAIEIAQSFQCPFVYVNRVGGEDEILFDGQSFIVDQEKILKAKPFTEDHLMYDITTRALNLSTTSSYNAKTEMTWENLMRPQWSKKSNGTFELMPWNDEDCENVLNGLIFGLTEYAKKSGMNKYLIGLSGGMDSALVLAILKLAFNDSERISALFMPSQYSSSLSYDLSEELCRNLKIKLDYFPIKFLHATLKNSFRDHLGQNLEGIADENIQSRLRGLMLYTKSNLDGSMVINTSNKSEIAVGYSTQYGDSVGAISLLGDLYKTEVYWLSIYINKKYKNIIPKAIIDRPPTAELRSDQKDTDSLPPYPILDAILEGLLSYRYSPLDLTELGFEKGDVKRVFDLVQRSEYKRFQFCPIIKIKAKSFGFGYRVPITKKYQSF